MPVSGYPVVHPVSDTRGDNPEQHKSTPGIFCQPAQLDNRITFLVCFRFSNKDYCVIIEISEPFADYLFSFPTVLIDEIDLFMRHRWFDPSNNATAKPTLRIVQQLIF